MMFLVATHEQKEKLEGLYNSRSEIQFFEYNGQWVTPISNLSNPDFDDIKDILISLPKLEYSQQINETHQ